MSVSVDHIGFLIPGSYPDDDPFDGLEKTLQLFELGERLGFDSAWVRQRHLEHGISSASAFLGAAGQRTSRIELGTAVIPLGFESPFRLAEDLSTVDVLARGRLNIGVSAGQPQHIELLGPLIFDGDWRAYDLSHSRVLRFINNLRGNHIGPDDALIVAEGDAHRSRQRPRLHPYAKGLIDRVWYGGGSLASARWTGEHGLNLLIGNLTRGETADVFFEAQLAQLDAFHEGARNASRVSRQRVALGRVIVPTDSADAGRRKKYADYAASRHERTLAPQGPRRILFNPDLVGPSEQILDWLHTDPVLARTSELRLELPYEFSQDEYSQILHDFVTLVAPELGWKPGRAAAGNEQP